MSITQAHQFFTELNLLGNKKEIADKILKEVDSRLGFLLERLATEETAAINECRSKLTTGNAKLDPALTADKLITKWRLWVPASWAKEK